MPLKPCTHISVYYTGRTAKIPVGKLEIKQGKISFEYDPLFMKTKLELSPLKLPLTSNMHNNQDFVFDGLFGVFNDSLPDGWGRLLLNRKLMQLKIPPDTLSPLDRLCYVGSSGMGALTYEPEIQKLPSPKFSDLDKIANAVLQFQEDQNETHLDHLLALNGYSAGARPKILTLIKGEDWIIKFPSSNDPKDIGAIEWAYHLMAQAAHLDLPEAQLFPSKQGEGYFGVKRFDRLGSQKVHMHTLSGLLHTDHRFPTLSYETILKATAWLTKDVKECLKQFRAAAFNILCHNRDDHAKNFSFLMDEKGRWTVSPSYDLTFSSGPSGEHCTMIMGEGRHPQTSHLLQLASLSGIEEKTALQIIDEVKHARSKWTSFAKEAGVTHSSSTLIQKHLNSKETP